jgi:Sap, sulfolipid-1-addressing protein
MRYQPPEMEVIVLGLISALRPATSQAAVFALLRAPLAARTLLAFAVAGLAMSILVGLLLVGALSGAGQAFGDSAVSDVVDIMLGVAALGFAAGVQRGTLDRRRERAPGRAPGRATSAIAVRLRNPSVVTAATAGAATHVPGLIYLVALNAIAAGDPGPASALVQVVVYNLLWFAIPLGALVLVLRSPATATAFVDRLTAWARSHQDRLLVTLFGALGIYLVAKGIYGILD